MATLRKDSLCGIVGLAKEDDLITENKNFIGRLCNLGRYCAHKADLDASILYGSRRVEADGTCCELSELASMIDRQGVCPSGEIERTVDGVPGIVTAGSVLGVVVEVNGKFLHCCRDDWIMRMKAEVDGWRLR